MTEAIQAVSDADLGVRNAETARFEVREHRLDAPPLAVVQGAQVARPFGAFRQREAVHGNDPGIGMAGIVNDADVAVGP